jgi:hypothetical protein
VRLQVQCLGVLLHGVSRAVRETPSKYWVCLVMHDERLEMIKTQRGRNTYRPC